MDIKLLQNSDDDQWEQYVSANPSATFYHSIGWKKVIEKSFGHAAYYLMAQENGKVCGILPIIHIKSMIFGSIMCSMPFLNFGGVCADGDEAERALLSEAERILKSKKGDYLELRHIKKSSLDYPAKTHKVSMTLELNRDPEILWKKFSSKHRQTIRKAAKNGLKIKFGKKELLNDFYAIMCRGWRELGTPIFSLSFFENIMDSLGDSVEICIVSYQGKAIGTAFVGLFKKTVEGMWLSFLKEFARLQTNYFQYWEMIKRACEQGYEEFHLGRSSVEGGGEFFKEKWNAIPRPLYWEYILNKNRKMPELNVDNPTYQLPMKIWRKLPLPVTKRIGPLLAKNIP